MDSICYYRRVHLCFTIRTFHIRWIYLTMIWYENTFEKLYWGRDYLRILRVKHIYHPHVFCDSIRSYLICLILFRGRISVKSYIFLVSIPRLYDYHLLRWYIILFIWIETEAIMINKIESCETSHSCFRSQSVVFPFRLLFNFRGRKFSF